jgi:MFS family permease
MFSFVGNRLNISGRIAGFFVMGGSFGSMLFPFLAGVLFERGGAKSLILLNSVMLVSALAVLFTLLKAFPKKQESSARI